ncbi:unnamed protein product [Thlaspi arvense]|uniref:Uncharacterized protein n=1 Tax=Thlaspi arvense TaxID=13288 RepID=A0AAU9SU54_THLAR|nr:unnamed protein product [Thlaspi arvense]
MEKISMKFVFVIFLAVMSTVTNVEAKRLLPEEAPQFVFHHDDSLQTVKPPTQLQEASCKPKCVQCVVTEPFAHSVC